MTKILIVGGVAGGMSAATRLRRLMEDAEIIVFDKGPYVSFANCGLPFHVSGEIAERESLIVQTPERLKARFAIDVRPESEVVAVDTDKKTITVRHADKVYEESYDKLILSPGAKPVVPQMEGLDSADNVFVLRNIPDLDKILNALNDTKAKRATVIGAGFIGLEMAAFVKDELTRNGITVYTNQSAKAFKDNGKVIILEDGSELLSDITIMSVGVQPESNLAKEAGLKLGMRGGILVNEYYQTSNPDIYAVGDAIIVKQEITGQDALISLASPANRQGRQVADNIAGIARQNKGSIGTAIVRVFDLAAASTGLSERIARQQFEDVAVVHTTSKDHASYYPNASDIVLKLIFNQKTGAIYGAQAVGQKGVDKRIDILATAIKAGLTVTDLPELEFTYAPPFGSAKDPVNMAGYAALNIMEGISENVQWYALSDELAKGKMLLDVRTREEVSRGHFANSINIPLDELRDRLAELDANQEYIISCHSGLRSYIGERILKQNGFKIQNLDGAYFLYSTVKPEEIVHD